MSDVENTVTPAVSPQMQAIEHGIDKLKLVIRSESLNDGEMKCIEQSFDNVATRPTTHTLTTRGKAFQRRLAVSVGGQRVIVECKPNKSNYPWAATVEFNPNPFLRKGDAAIANLWKFLRTIFGVGARRILATASVTMMHVNVDYAFNPLDGTLVTVKGKRGGAKVLYDFDGSGVLGTLYVGVLGSDRRLTVYNKGAEILHRELGPHADAILAALASDKWDIEVSKLQQMFGGEAHWRLEVRCIPKHAVPLPEIGQFASCFKGVRFVRLPVHDARFNSAMGRLFISAARADGVSVALQALDPKERRLYASALSQQDPVEWFNEEILQGLITTVIGRLMAPVAQAGQASGPLDADVRQPVRKSKELAGTKEPRLAGTESPVLAQSKRPGRVIKRIG
ncbi:hypothetical protein [Pandoraea anhela]|uniref:Uncharacterized protein n=1 Tax=Pandoraea anhela TaxID=2508295 RepID=A0A5E4Z4W7_9BURK|nr:hypothetical protein [Pandoraea anhela]VVE56139.1 hypothetical protein PAN31108_05068 [Pandoraea anhela]